MSNTAIKKIFIATLVATLILPAGAATAATPAAKKITVAQGTKIYEKAVKATNLWLSKTAHTITKQEQVGSNKEMTSSVKITVDLNGNMLIAEESGDLYIIGEKMYAENVEGNLAGYEVEIAKDLGLPLDAKFAVLSPLLLDPEYPINEFRDEYSKVDDQGFTGEREGAKTTLVTYRKVGTTETLTITQTYPAKNGRSAVKNVTSTKIDKGLIASISNSATWDGETYKTINSYKAFTGVLTAPAGPYLDWDKVYLDPRYEVESNRQIASLILDSYIREAKAYAAFESVDTLTIDIWKEVAMDANEDVKMYDKGIQFTYSTGDEVSKVACGVFTESGAKLELKSCSELGFMLL